MAIAAWTVNMRKPTKNWIDRKCLICNSDFKVMPWRIKKGGGLYCSIHCLNVRNGRKYAENCDGENNANWKGGLTSNLTMRIIQNRLMLNGYVRHVITHNTISNSGRLPN